MRIIAGEFKGRTIRTTSGPGYRPATGKVREALFSMLEARGVAWPETRVLDLFAGSGSLGLEALSRRAAYACFVERAKAAAGLIRANLKALGVGADRAGVVAKDVQQALDAPCGAPFDLVFVDPPYGLDLLEGTLAKLAAKGIVREEGLVAAEVEAALKPAGRERPGLIVEADRLYGQTRIVLWRKSG